MPSINLILEEPAWPDLADRDDIIDYQDPIGMTALPAGMTSGATSVAFRFENTVVNLVIDPAELIEPAPAGTGTTAMYTVFVDDCDAAVALLRSRGVDLLNGPVDRPWGVRTAAFADADGHAWEIAQQL